MDSTHTLVMEECPLCFKSFALPVLERHVNTCLDTRDVSPEPTQPQKENVFAALGLKSQKSDKTKKGGATLTSILLAEKRLKRKQEELENKIKRRALERGRGNQESQGSKYPDGEGSTKGASQEAKGGLESRERVSWKESALENSQSTLESAKESAVKCPGDSAQKSPKESATEGSKDTGAAQYLQLKRESELPLAQRLRPQSLDDYFGQEKLMGKNGVLRNLIQSPNIPSFILWGVPGVGKTSLARLVAKTSDHKFVELSGADSNAKKLKEAFAQAQNEKNLTGKRTILFLDEIHRFNKATQDLLLPVIEKGTLVVIGATTENPSFTLNNALLSRMHTFVMDPLSEEALVKILNRGLLLVNKTRKFVHKLHLIALDRSAIDHIASLSLGDSRVALNLLESINAYLSGLELKEFEAREEKESVKTEKVGVIRVTQKDLQPLLSSRNFHLKYDRNGENHYDAISAFHKSVRGSNADAALFYLVRMLKGGEDPLFIARRMIVIASEDIGLRDSSCLPFAIAAMEAVQFVGMPEGEIVLAHCATKLARAPKSTKSYRALRKAQSLLETSMDSPIPLHLRNAPTSLMKDLGYGNSYKYNPNFKHGIIKQSFMPEGLENVTLVEDTHLGDMIDEEVDPKDYENADENERSYREYKEWKKPISDERLASYDENLSRDDQPDFFDGTEADVYPESGSE